MSSSSSTVTSSSKTPHRRRRKAPPLEDKENEDTTSQSSNQACVAAPTNSTNVLLDALAEFRNCLKAIISTASLFQEESNLEESVLRASLVSNAATGLWHVQEHASALVSLARKLIKQQQQQQQQTASMVDKYLFVAVHCIRAVAALEDSSIGQVETNIRLLYHVITTASSSSSSADNNKVPSETNNKLGLIVMAAMEGLCKLLPLYSCNCGRIVRFHRLANDESGWGVVVPVWSHNDDKVSTATGTMTLRQVVTIALKACLACASAQGAMWWQMSVLAAKSSSSVESKARQVEAAAARYGDLARLLLQAHKHPLPQSLRQLLSSFYLPWLGFVADSGDDECIKDLPAHCKAAHRLLWDMAAKFKGATLFTSPLEMENACLALRQDAIELLLPETTTKEGRAVIRETQFESACSYAWKAASVYAQQQQTSLPVASNSPLGIFYQAIGSKLDAIAMAAATPPTMAYIEFCVYRALHCNVMPQMAEDDKSVGALILSVALLAIQSKHRLMTTTGQNRAAENDWCGGSDDISSYLSELVGAFESTVLSQWTTTLSADDQNRYFKLLSALSLHRCIFQVLKQQQHNNKGLDKESLHIVAVVLRQCVGPVALLMAKACTSTTDPSKVNAMLDMAVECYIRPLAAFGRLSEMSGDDGVDREYYEGMANDTIREIYRIFFQEDRLPNALLEKCAKSIALLARQRTDASRILPSIVPTLYSLPMYQYLAQQQEGDSDYQLSARLAHLAGSLQSLDMNYHAMVVLSHAIAQELPNCYNNNEGCQLSDWNTVDFLNFLASHCKHVFSPVTTNYQPTALARSSIRRLITEAAKVDSSKQNHNVDDNDFNGAWLAFLAGTTPEDQKTRIVSAERPSPAGMLLSRILSLRAPEEMLQEQTGTIRSFLVLIEMMAEIGASLDGLEESSSVEPLQWQLEDCNLIVRHLEEHIVPQLGQSAQLLLPMVQVVASTCLIPGKIVNLINVDLIEGVAPTVRDDVIQRARESALALEKMGGDDDDDGSCQRLLAAVVSYFCHQLQSDRRDHDVNIGFFDQCRICMHSFQKVGALDQVQEFCRRAFLWTLSHFQSQLEVNGDCIRSVIVSHWILELVDKGDTDECSWFHSNALRTLLASPASSDPVLNSLAPQFSLESFAQMELQLSVTRAQIVLGREFDVDSAMEQVRTIKHELDRSESTEVKQKVMTSWLLSSVYLTLAEYDASTGAFVDSLKHLQESSRQCMAVIFSTKRSVTPNGDARFWESAALATFLPRANQRYAELLSMRSKLYSRIGDHRKSIGYLATLSDFLGISVDSASNDLGPDVEEMMQSGAGLEEKPFRRLNAELRCSASSLDSIVQGLQAASSQWPCSAWSENDDEARKLQVILDVFSVGDLVYGESIKSPFQSAFPAFYEEALEWYTDTFANSDLLQTSRNSTREASSRLAAKVAIRKVRCLIHRHPILDVESRSKVRKLCQDVMENSAAQADDRAWAYYYAADLEIDLLRSTEALGILWNSDCNDMSEEDKLRLEQARSLLISAVAAHPTGSDILSRIILRNLALVTGPEHTSGGETLSAGDLVLMSIGQSYRQLMIRSLAEVDGEDSRVKDLLDFFKCSEDTTSALCGGQFAEILKRLAEVVPSTWKFVASTLCPSGDLLITSIEKRPKGDGMNVVTRCIEPKSSESVYDDIMVPLDEIIHESQNQLHGMDVNAVCERFSKEEAKREWWEKRHKLDEDLQALLERAEDSYFSSLHLRSDLTASISQSAQTSALPIGNLASKFEAVIDTTLPKAEESEDSLRKLTVPTLKERLRDEFGFPDSKLRKMKKQDLIDSILSESKCRQETKETPTDGCLFLILDENLHRFPFEGMPSLAGHAVCRVPSLSFVLASLCDINNRRFGQTPFVDASRTSYVLDPESNLLSTRNRLQPVLDGIATDNAWDWDSTIGRMPSVDFFEQGLGRDDGLLMYFGHGGAQTCFSRKQVESLVGKRDGHDVRACHATVILMGCSSGRLVSVNRKRTQVLEQVPLHYEPEGIALSYLCAGAPCVVGNLWDVTDHDIDRYSTTLLERFLQPKRGASESLASCVANSRGACKLRFIVGCAPVCYGVPVYLSKSS